MVRVRFALALLVVAAAVVGAPRPCRGAAAALRVHPGPPLWGEFVIEQDQVRFHLEGERQELRALLGLPEARAGATSAELMPDMRAALKDRFHELLHVSIDGAPVKPELLDLEIPDEDPDSFKPLTITATLRYACTGVPRSVSLTMDQSEGRDWFSAANLPLLLKHDKNAQMIFLTRLEPEFTWHRPALAAGGPRALTIVEGGLRTDASIPIGSLGLLVGAIVVLFVGLAKHARPVPLLGSVVALVAAAWLMRGLLDVRLPDAMQSEVEVPEPALARSIFETLHGNIYRAFDVSTENEIYDLLAVSVEPGLLDALYGDIYESLILREDGGAVCVIQDVVRERAEVVPQDAAAAPPPAPQFTVDCTWRVVGNVAHWGHIHMRVNEYRALYTVRHADHAWKIAAVEVKDHQRVDSNG